MVGQVAHRVQGFTGGARGDHHVRARCALGGRRNLGCFGEVLLKGCEDILGFAHSPWANVATGLLASGRADQLPAVGGQLCLVTLRGGMAPHGLVHGGGHQPWRFRSKAQSGQQVVGHAVRQARHHIGRGRGHQQGIGPAGQFNVPHPGFCLGVQQRGAHGLARESLQRQGGDEGLSTLGHHHAHLTACLLQQSHDQRAFIRGNTGADAQQHALTCEQGGRRWF